MEEEDEHELPEVEMDVAEEYSLYWGQGIEGNGADESSADHVLGGAADKVGVMPKVKAELEPECKVDVKPEPTPVAVTLTRPTVKVEIKTEIMEDDNGANTIAETGGVRDSSGDESFHSFSEEDLLQINRDDKESDLDLEWDGLDYNFDSSSSSEDEEHDMRDGVWSPKLRRVEIQPFTEPIGPVHNLPVDASALDYFSLLLPESFFTTMADETNRYSEQVQAEKGKPDKKWRPATADEMKLYVAIAIMMGIMKLPRQRLYWSEDDRLNVPCISKLMSENRYTKIQQYLHLNDRTKFIPRGQPGHDPLFKVRPLIDIVKQSFSEHYNPGRQISIDEAMVKFNGRLYFKQYIRLNPTPWGVKVWCCCDPANGYLLDFEVYTGKSDCAGKGLSHHVVTTIGGKYLNKNHQFFFDNFFTSPALVTELLEKDTYACGTCLVNRKDWPKDLVFGKKIKKKDRMKVGETRMRQNGGMLATAWQDKRTVTVLSTGVQPEMGTAKGQSGRGPRVDKDIPQPILTYNKSMGGVNLFDQQRHYYAVGRQCRKWWRYLFWFFLEATIINAFHLYKLSTLPRPQSPKAHDPLFFRLDLYDGLVKGRVVTFRQVQSPVSFAGRAISDPAEHVMTRMPGRKRNCMVCQKKKQRTDSGRGVQTVYGCTLCKVNICKGICFAQFHSQLLQ